MASGVTTLTASGSFVSTVFGMMTIEADGKGANGSSGGPGPGGAGSGYAKSTRVPIHTGDTFTVTIAAGVCTVTGPGISTHTANPGVGQSSPGTASGGNAANVTGQSGTGSSGDNGGNGGAAGNGTRGGYGGTKNGDGEAGSRGSGGGGSGKKSSAGVGGAAQVMFTWTSVDTYLNSGNIKGGNYGNT